MRNPNKQAGFIEMTGWDLLFIVAVIGVLGWVAIECLLWLFGHISIQWVG